MLTLAQAPAADQKLTLSYATTPDVQGFQKGTSLHGQLRDSDDFIGQNTETLQTQVTSGSPEVSAATGTFAHRAGRDIVTAAGLPAGTIVVSSTADTLTLSSPRSGPSGSAELSFHHDQHNYCVHFSLVIP